MPVSAFRTLGRQTGAGEMGDAVPVTGALDPEGAEAFQRWAWADDGTALRTADREVPGPRT
jgi:hypothetical protein